ncbi:C39 family peptidase [Paenibacillus sp. FSL H8-0317]|uniref:C39 family peptidase n=1 Tax=Paenibacillus sp. FSL H8-0317 TaxID=2921385 RepID=UPI00324366B8
MAIGDLKTVGVTPFKQETTYWCGPATSKQVLNYLNGSSESQSYYAQKLGTTKDGTDFTVVDDVLNNLQSNYTYSYSTSLPIESWKYAIMYSSDNYHPAVLDLKITGNELENYTGTVSGHIINVSGYEFRTNDAKVRLTDPYDQGNRGKTHGNKWYTLEKVWQANQNHFRQAIIW